MESTQTKSQVGLIGLAVMGQNLVMNMLDHGWSVSVYNRTSQRTDEMLKNAEQNVKKEAFKLVGTYDLQKFVESLEKPRKIILLVKSGAPVDEYIQSLKTYCDSDDIIIDAGNSNYLDTIRRCKENPDIIFVGSGVSGGEEGARFGPSIMPGGNVNAKAHIMPIFESISAKAGKDNSVPCTTWIGNDGSGHFVKMVHNGIEYGDMQMICEAYDIMRRGLSMNNDQIADTFDEWNKGHLKSYLIEITASIFRAKNNQGKFIIDTILDKAGQKGTGKWTINAGLEFGSAVSVISQAVFCRMISSLKDFRCEVSKNYSDRKNSLIGVDDAKIILSHLKDALLCSKIASYAQGFSLMSEASDQYDWKLDLAEISKIFRNGCIIRSDFLDQISQAYATDSNLASLFLDNNFFAPKIKESEAGWRDTIVFAIRSSIPCPAISSALNYFDSIRSEKLPANLIQAQRDFFGAHTFETIDEPGVWKHHIWTVGGGLTTSGAYNA